VNLRSECLKQQGAFNLPSGPYEKPLERFAECLDKRLQKDKQYTLHQVSVECGVHVQTVSSYVRQNLTELNKYVTERGKKVQLVKIVKEIPGLVVDPLGSNDAGLLVPLAGLVFLGLLVLIALPMFPCGRCGTPIHLTGWNQPYLSCPKCGQVYVR